MLKCCLLMSCLHRFLCIMLFVIEQEVWSLLALSETLLGCSSEMPGNI